MAITIGNTSSSGDKGSTTVYSWDHTCQAGTNCLVVITRARDSVIGDADVQGITYDDGATPFTGEAHSIYDAGNDYGIEVWYLINPTIGVALAIEVTHGGKCSDVSAGAIDLKGVDTGDVVDVVANDTGANGDPHIQFVGPDADSHGIGGVILHENDAGFLAPGVGTVPIDEVDMGSHIAGAARRSAGQDIEWNSVNDDEYWTTCGATFNAALDRIPRHPAHYNPLYIV